MREEFEKLVATGKLNRQHIDPLVTLVESGYCLHRSWGFGKITTVDTVFARFTIDFENKAGHNMDLSFAAESLKPIPNDHVLARKISDIESLRQMAALNHLDLIQLVLQSFGGQATVDQIQKVLVPDIIADDWKKWWEVAKRELKKSGHFLVPQKKSEPIVYQSTETSLQDRLLGDLRAAKGLKARLTVANELLKNLEDLSDAAAAGAEAITALNGEILTHQRTQPAVALEAVFVRDDLRQSAGLPEGASEITTGDIWLQDERIGALLEALPAAKHRRALESFKAARPENWHEAVLNQLNYSSSKLSGELAHALIQSGKLEGLKEMLSRLINQHQASSALLLWLARERSDTYADILGPEVFRAMLTAMERDQFNEKRSNKLRDFIVDDATLLVELIGAADIEVIKDLTRALQLSPCFDDMDKRSLLARIVKNYPAVQSMITGDQPKQEANLIVSWESLERRKNEYNELVQKTIPSNSTEIAIARSYGDLRENHEYKAAKEMQKLLMRRKSELEAQLVRARGSDFLNPRTDLVSIGTKVTVTDTADQHVETFTILGAWDSEPEKNVISYLTPVAQALLNRQPGEEVECEWHGTRKKLRIGRIEPYRTAPAPEAPTPASPGATSQLPVQSDNTPTALVSSAPHAQQTAAGASDGAPSA